MASNGGNGQWKWIAGICAALIVGFLPGYISNLNDPTSEQFSELQHNQQEAQLKLAVLAAQNKTIIKAVDEARKRIILLQTKGQK